MDEQEKADTPKEAECAKNFTWDDLVSVAIHYGPSARHRLALVRVDDGTLRRVVGLRVRKVGKDIQLELEVEP